MMDLEELFTAPPPTPIAAGDHGDTAERYQQDVLFHIAKLKIVAEMLDLYVRQHPDDDVQVDYWAEQIYPTITACGHAVHTFRATRDCAGEG